MGTPQGTIVRQAKSGRRFFSSIGKVGGGFGADFSRARKGQATSQEDSEDVYRSGSRNASHQQQGDYSHPYDHTRQTTDTPGFKPFAKVYQLITTTPDTLTLNTGIPVDSKNWTCSRGSSFTFWRSKMSCGRKKTTVKSVTHKKGPDYRKNSN